MTILGNGTPHVRQRQGTACSRLVRTHEALGTGDSGMQLCVYEGFQFCALFRRQRGATSEEILHTAVLRCREVRIRLKTLDEHCRLLNVIAPIRRQCYVGGVHMRVYASHGWPQNVPRGRLFIGVADATQERFPEVLADEL
jgi:hypothetical protein